VINAWTIPSDSINFCDSDLCASLGRGLTHVACGRVEEPPNCGDSDDAYHVPITPKLISIILSAHNEVRQSVANGSVEHLPPATRMQTMQWDDTLAYTAFFNLKDCILTNDKCRTTPKYHNVGQNTHVVSASVTGYWDVELKIEDIIKDAWFKNLRDIANAADLTFSYPPSDEFHEFATIVQDRANRVGCAMHRWSYGGWDDLFVTCNYNYQVFEGSRVYEAGESASGCGTLINEEYPALCDECK